MYTLTSNAAPYVHIGCSCGRKYMIEEMYISYSIGSAICRFCTRDTINDVFCPCCCTKTPIREARQIDNRCANCLQCPLCFNKLVINRKLINNQKTHFLVCMSCKWDSINLKLLSPELIEIYSIQRMSSQTKITSKTKVFELLLSRLKYNQEEIMKREKKEIRKNKKTLIADEIKLPHQKEKVKYTRDMYANDEEKRTKNREKQHIIGNSITQDIIDGKTEIKDLKEGLKDYLDLINPTEELDLDKELQNTEDAWNLNDVSTLEQRLKDVYFQPRKTWRLTPISVPNLPYVTKICKKSEKFIIRPKLTKIQLDEGYFEHDHLLMKNFPSISIKAIDAKDGTKADVYIRFTNPNYSVCTIQIDKLSTTQSKVIKPTCVAMFPKNELCINFLVGLISEGDINLSTEMFDLPPPEEDKQYISQKDKNYLLLKIPCIMSTGFDATRDEVRFGFKVQVKFERETKHQVKCPVYILTEEFQKLKLKARQDNLIHEKSNRIYLFLLLNYSKNIYF